MSTTLKVFAVLASEQRTCICNDNCKYKFKTVFPLIGKDFFKMIIVSFIVSCHCTFNSCFLLLMVPKTNKIYICMQVALHLHVNNKLQKGWIELNLCNSSFIITSEPITSFLVRPCTNSIEQEYSKNMHDAEYHYYKNFAIKEKKPASFIEY